MSFAARPEVGNRLQHEAGDCPAFSLRKLIYINVIKEQIWQFELLKILK